MNIKYISEKRAYEVWVNGSMFLVERGVLDAFFCYYTV